jgi:hypothetical protein
MLDIASTRGDWDQIWNSIENREGRTGTDKWAVKQKVIFHRFLENAASVVVPAHGIGPKSMDLPYPMPLNLALTARTSVQFQHPKDVGSLT